jgi:mRNA interferase RelE/StbE
VTYTIFLTPRVQKELGRLPEDIRRRINDAIAGLQMDPLPPGHRKLHTRRNTYQRIRVGAYRVVYHIEHDRLIVIIIRAGHRKKVYRGI